MNEITWKVEMGEHEGQIISFRKLKVFIFKHKLLLFQNTKKKMPSFWDKRFF